MTNSGLESYHRIYLTFEMFKVVFKMTKKKIFIHFQLFWSQMCHITVKYITFIKYM